MNLGPMVILYTEHMIILEKVAITMHCNLKAALRRVSRFGMFLVNYIYVTSLHGAVSGGDTSSFF